MYRELIQGNRVVACLVGAAALLYVASCTDPGEEEESTAPTIEHVQVPGDQPVGEPVHIEARVTDPDGIASVQVFYQAPHAGTWESLGLTLDPIRAGSYGGEIPGPAIMPPGVSYYFEATDNAGETARLPAAAPEEYFTITVSGGDDQEGPMISHVKVADNRPLGTAVPINAKVTDTTGVANVICHYRVQGATDWISIYLDETDEDQYSTTLPNETVILPGVEYWLEATDTTPLSNRSTLPMDAPTTVFAFTVSPGDDQPPVITHTPIADGQPEGRPVGVVARVEDVSGVGRVTLFYRASAAGSFNQLEMTQSSSSAPWSGIIPASAVTSVGVDYYIEAEDLAPLGNIAVAPDTAPTTPYTFTTAPETCVPPPLLKESFEAGILPGWWREFSAGGGCVWEVTDARGHDGSYSVEHGYGSGCSDLLVMPCLDLTGYETEGLVIDFWQYHTYSSYVESHTLEWALNSPDPSAATYTALAPQIPVESENYEWGYQRVVIPPGSQPLGNAKVYFAFRYVGDNADKWNLDEIGARAPGPAIEFAYVEASPNPVAPGASGVELSVTLRNSGDAASPALTGTLSTADAEITITNDTASFPAVDVGAETISQTPFVISVAGSHAEGPATLSLHVTDGSRSYDFPIELYIGTRANAHIVMTTSSLTWEQDVELYLGVGLDPDNPDWIDNTNIAGGSSSTGTFTYDVDLSTHLGDLPPSMDHPWFLKVVHKYSGTCLIDDFTISYGASSRQAQNLPWQAPDGSSSSPAVGYVRLPEPPLLAVDAVVTAPATVSPGSSGVTMSVTVRNLGSPTEGALSGTLALAAPTTGTDVTGLTPTTAVTFTTGPLGTNATATNTSQWTYNVTAAHNDGSPVHFLLTITDATSGLTWPLKVDVPVPWPGVSIKSWTSNTGTSDGDFLPDPGETVDLVLAIQNTGTLVTAGQVSGTMSVNAGSTASVTVDAGSNSSTFGTAALAPGETATANATYRIVVGGSAQYHQTVILDLTLTDGTSTWVRQLAIPLYQQFGGADPKGDESSAIVDLRWGFFTCDGTTLDVRVVGWDPFEADDARLSVIVAEPPSGIGQAVRLRLNQGTLSASTLGATGWEDATTPPSLSFSPESGTGTTITFRVPLSELVPLGLTLSGEARLGLQSDGYGSTIYDYFPDAWSSEMLTDLVIVTW